MKNAEKSDLREVVRKMWSTEETYEKSCEKLTLN